MYKQGHEQIAGLPMTIEITPKQEKKIGNIKALFINGSPRKIRNTHKAFESAMKGAQSAGECLSFGQTTC